MMFRWNLREKTENKIFLFSMQYVNMKLWSQKD